MDESHLPNTLEKIAAVNGKADIILWWPGINIRPHSSFHPSGVLIHLAWGSKSKGMTGEWHWIHSYNQHPGQETGHYSTPKAPSHLYQSLDSPREPLLGPTTPQSNCTSLWSSYEWDWRVWTLQYSFFCSTLTLWHSSMCLRVVIVCPFLMLTVFSSTTLPQFTFLFYSWWAFV